MKKRDALALLISLGTTGAIAQERRPRRGPPPGGGAGRRRGGGGPRPEELGASPLGIGDPGIAWYPRLEDGIAEAKRSNRPILFMSVASQCGGVPGVF